MLKRYSTLAAAASMLCSLISCPISAGAEAAVSHYVSEAWIDVLPSPDVKSKAVTHWTTNTKVYILKKEGTWCRAQAEDNTTGYIHCSAVADKPLTLQDIAPNLKTGEQIKDAEAKAFWIAPSFGSFESYGTSLNYSMLNERQNREQQTTHKAIRFPIAQFDAMKQKLAAGILPRFEDHVQRQPLEEAASQQGQLLLTPEMFPTIKASLFKKPADVLMLPEAYTDSLTDSLTAMIGKPSKGIAQGKPEYEQGHDDEGVAGIWDIKELKIKYAEPVVLYAISRNGLVGARSISEDMITGASFSDGCSEGYADLPQGKLLAGYPKIKDRITAFYTTKSIPEKSVQIKSSKLRVYVKKTSYDDSKELRNMILHVIDLDADAIPDIAVLENRGPGAISADEISNFDFFLNINGSWLRAGSESYGECT